jgi:hypothetical protein
MPKFQAMTTAIALFVMLSVPAKAQADPSYLKGYVEAVLAHVLKLTNAGANVSDGVANVSGALSDQDKKRVRARLIKIDGINDVQFSPAASYAD